MLEIFSYTDNLINKKICKLSIEFVKLFFIVNLFFLKF